jgi:CheY-like chemotaxis protein
MLTIADTGPGIDPEILRHLFEPFHTTKKQGTGLGLSTAYRMVKRMRGDIWAESQSGQGTTFTVCLPHAESASKIHEANQPLRPAGHGSETILLAEDDESVRKLIKHLLSATGYQVLEAVNGGQALQVFHEHAGEIDLLITDMVMPGLNGRELANQALGAKPALKVIFMSGYTDDVLLNTGALGPEISYLRKPLKLDVLTNLVRQVLDSRSSE